MLDFSKKFVCARRDYSTYREHINAPVFRRSFVLGSKPDKAEILISGLGFYDLFLNGERITKGYLAPYISNPDHIVYYDSYDLTDKLVTGENVIGVVLGNGLQNPMTLSWDFWKAAHTSSPKMALAFEAVCGDEKVEFDATTFKCTDSPITFDSLHFGIHYDARLEEDGWCEAGFDDSGWREVLTAENPRGEKKLCTVEPIILQSEIKPISVKAGKLAPFFENDYFDLDFEMPEGKMEREGGYIYDFGRDAAGVFRFRIKNAKRGQKISFQCAEMLNDKGELDYQNIGRVTHYPDGYVQRDIYICRGDKEEEIFVPMFVYHGYRYLYISGIEAEQATLDAVTYLEIYSDIKTRAEFSCSDEIVNTLWKMTLNSDFSNFHYFPTDCPHREKNGWTGDASMSAEHMIFTLTCEKSIREWLNHIRKAQNIEGALPGIVPTTGWGFDWGNGPAWDSVLFNLPYMLYIYRGETEVISENSHAMVRYLEYISGKRNERGLIECGLGDWSPVNAPGGGSNAYHPALEFTDSVMVYDMCRKAEVMFSAVGKDLNALYAKAFGDELLKKIRKYYIDFSTMTVEGYSQAGQAMALYYGIFEPCERPEASRRLVEIVHANGDAIEFGFLGARVLFHALSDCGEYDLAYKMIVGPEFPSYGYNISLGLTALPEIFNYQLERMESLNHHFYGDINHWFLRHILGINVNPYKDNPNEIVISPEFISSLDFAEGSYEAPAGKAYVRWERDGDKIKLTVSADEGIKLSVKLKNGYCFGVDRFYRSYINEGIKDETVYQTAKLGKKPPVMK